MKFLSAIVFVICLLFSCKSNNSKKCDVSSVSKKKGILEEYKSMKKKLEPQGYIITTDSVDKIFIDNSVTINYNKKNKK